MHSPPRRGQLNNDWRVVSKVALLQTLQDGIGAALGRIANNFIGGIADFVVVLIFLGIGYVVARFLAGVVKRGLHELRLERKLEEKGIHDALLGFTVSDIIVTLVKISTFAVFLGVAADVVNLTFLNTIVYWFLSYLPMLIEGVIVIVAALLFGDFIADRIRKAHGVPFAGSLGLATKIFVGYTAIVIALPRILPGADVDILKTFFILIVGAVAVAIGVGFAIALGLGLKDTINDVAKERKKEFKKIIS